MLTSDGFWMLYIIYLIVQELQWDFDGFSELASAKIFDSKFAFQKKENNNL